MKKLLVIFIYITFAISTLFLSVQKLVVFNGYCEYDKNVKNAKCIIKNDNIYQNNYYSRNIKELNKIDFYYKDKTYKISLHNEGTFVQQKYFKNGFQSRIYLMNFAKNNGFTKKESVCYAFPEIKKGLSKIEKDIFKPEVEPKLISIKNTGKIDVIKPEMGLKIDEIALFDSIFYKINNFFETIELQIPVKIINYKTPLSSLERCKKLRGSFKTNFKSSNESRKNNIRKALEKLDGLVLDSGEILSFNKITGNRSEDNGYMKAKAIKNGSYYEEFGGGVCQVSTTLYNAALVSGLDIIEVSPHSLPVSYVEPCFDAMVNTGSSDLKIKNNTNGPIIIATSSKDDVCLVNIYGIKNNFEVIRKSKIVEQLSDYEKETTVDYVRAGLTKPLEKGETKVISYGKPGYKAIAWLEYYIDGVLVKTKNIRENIYKPTKEVVLVAP